MTLKTDDLIFLAMDSPDYAALPPDPARPGVRLDYTQPIASPYMRGVGMAPAARDSTDEPLSMVEAWEKHNGYSHAESERRHIVAMRRLRSIQAGSRLAQQIPEERVLQIIERIRACQRQR